MKIVNPWGILSEAKTGLRGKQTPIPEPVSRFTKLTGKSIPFLKRISNNCSKFYH